VQIDAGPIPTFTASTPALTSAALPSLVATLPAMISTRGNAVFTARTVSTTAAECPWRRIDRPSTSAPARTSASARASRSGPGADRGADPQPPEVVLGGVRVADRLLDVLHRDEAAELVPLVHDGQLLDPVAVQDLLRLVEA
jgi:hypothetical protein